VYVSGTALSIAKIYSQVKSSQVNDVPRTQTGHSLYVRITINVLHITSILFHVKLRSDTRIIVVLAF